jgi:Tfp pilus assembly protein PilF
MKKSFALFLIILIAVVTGCGRKKESQTNLVNTKGKKEAAAGVLSLRDGNDLLAKGRCTDATNAYLRFLQKYPSDPGALNLLGLSYLCESKHDLAIAAFNKALQLRPNYTDVHNNLGVAYMELKNYPAARKEFLVALQDRSYMKAGPYFNLAKLAFSEQSYEESRALAKKAMELVPKQKDGLPEEAAPLLLYSLSLERLNRLDEAAAAFRDLLKIDSQNVEASYTLATIMARKNQPCVARQYYLQVVDADPLSDLGQKSIAALKGIQCQQ